MAEEQEASVIGASGQPGTDQPTTKRKRRSDAGIPKPQKQKKYPDLSAEDLRLVIDEALVTFVRAQNYDAMDVIASSIRSALDGQKGINQ